MDNIENNGKLSRTYDTPRIIRTRLKGRPENIRNKETYQKLFWQNFLYIRHQGPQKYKNGLKL